MDRAKKSYAVIILDKWDERKYGCLPCLELVLLPSQLFIFSYNLTFIHDNGWKHMLNFLKTERKATIETQNISNINKYNWVQM